MFRRLNGSAGRSPRRRFSSSTKRLAALRVQPAEGDLRARAGRGGGERHARFRPAGRDPGRDALAALVALKGIGRWSAEIYLIFALGRDDIWPAADLGLQFGVASELGLGPRLGERALRELGERWRPWRSVAACLFWQSYLHARNRAAPVLPAELYA